MDKKKNNREEKVGADGLTKKERRALKVQARQTDDNKVELKNNKTSSVQSSIQKNDTNKLNENEDCTKEIGNQQKATSVGLEKSVEKSNILSEKEQRKLEWDKKLSQQKKEAQNSQSQGDNQGLTKAAQKAKRREIQEAQRLAKITAEQEKSKQVVKIPEVKKKELKSPNTPSVVKIKKSPTNRNSPLTKKLLHGSKVQLLHHLYLGDSKSSEVEDSVCLPNIHPAFLQLGVQYSTQIILGSNARCISLLAALNCLIEDLKTPPEQEFCRYFESVLQNCTDYLQKCRPMAVSMTNALRLFKLQLTQIDTNISDEEKRRKLLDFIAVYVKEEIMIAGEAISMKVLEKISDGDIILIYGCSSLVQRILEDAFKMQKQFKVIVVDSRPLLEGREMLRRLTEAGIECKYILINALSYVMAKVTKVLLGAHALLANGYVMSRTGTAQVALVAQAFNKSVLVCCETYKFSEKVQTDSLVYNEIGDPDRLLSIDTLEKSSPLSAWKENTKLTPLNLLYDVTPPDLVTAVVTELAILPCTSVPVVLRLKPTEL